MRDPRFHHTSAPQGSLSATDERVVLARRGAMNLATEPADVAGLVRACEEREFLPREVRAAFDETFVGTVRADAERRRSWSEALRAAIAVATADVHTLTDPCANARDREMLQMEALSWPGMNDPFFVWQAREYEHGATDAAALELHMLLRLDSRAWLEALDALPAPSLMWSAVWLSEVPENPELIVELLKRAPPVFDQEGRWTRSVALLIVTYVVLDYAERQHRRALEGLWSKQAKAEHATADRTLDALSTQELPGWFSKAYDTLLARSDGIRVARGLLSDFSEKHLREIGRGSSSDWHASSIALAALVAALARHTVSVESIRAFWQAREAIVQQESDAMSARRIVRAPFAKKSAQAGEGKRTLAYEVFPLLYGSACVLDAASAHGDSAFAGPLVQPDEDEIERFWAWFAEVLEGRAPGLWAVSTGPQWSDQVQPIAQVLARVPDPAAMWRTTYARLEPQRRRSQHLVRYEDHDGDEPSLLLVRVGLCVCPLLAEAATVPRPTQDLHTFFWTLYDAARRLWLTAGSDPVDVRQELVAECFAFMPSVFGDALGEALKRAAPPIAAELKLLPLAACNLTRNGVEPRRVSDLLAAAGADLCGALRDAYELALLTERTENFPQAFQDLADSLGLSLGEPDEPPEAPEDRLRRHRDMFVGRVPWGASLLDRLRQDGCDAVRIDPLDESGATWLVQARVSALLRDAFSLAPELRILVAPAGFDIRALFAAAEDPSGATEVDPDFLLIATDRVDLVERRQLLPGPWGQRIGWIPSEHGFPPLPDHLRAHAQDFDLWSRVDPVLGRQLFGREEEIAFIASRMLRGEAVGVFGLSKVGKSSLLRAVAEGIDPVGATSAIVYHVPVHRPGGEVQALVIALDVQRMTGAGLDKLLRPLCDALRARLDAAGIQPDSPTAQGEPPEEASSMSPLFLARARALRALDDFERLLRFALAAQPLPVCCILDECDLLFEDHLGEPHIRYAELLLERLRRLAEETRRVSLALIGRDPAPLFRDALGAVDNPLRSWCQISWMGPLRRDEGDDLLTRLGRRVGLAVGPLTRDRAWALTGGFPFLLRQYGSALLEVSRGDRSEGVRRPTPTDDLRDEAEAHFRVRNLVLETGREIRMLLSRQFPAARPLFDALVRDEDLRDAVAGHGGWEGEAATVLRRYGVLTGSAEAPQIPHAFRRVVARAVPARPAALRRRRPRRGA